MPVENPDFISGLVPTDPAGSESVGEADDHIRTLKRTITNTFAGQAGDYYDKAVTVGPDYLNGLPATFDQYVTLAGDETITGEKTFTQDVTLEAAKNSAGSDFFRWFDLGGGDLLTAFGNHQAKVGLASNNADDICHYYNDGTKETKILTVDNFMATMRDALYPVGSIRLTADDVNPDALLGGTWEKISEGRYFAGAGSSTDADGEAGTLVAGKPAPNQDGLYRVKLTEEEMPSHTHRYSDSPVDVFSENLRRGIASTYHDNEGNVSYSGGFDGDDAAEKGDNAFHQNSPPYYGMYAWRRTA